MVKKYVRIYRLLVVHLFLRSVEFLKGECIARQEMRKERFLPVLACKQTFVLACKQTLFYFSFRSFQKHWRVKWARKNERRERKIKIFFFPHLYPLVLAVNKSPAVYSLSAALDGLWRENRGSANRLFLFRLAPLFLAACTWHHHIKWRK